MPKSARFAENSRTPISSAIRSLRKLTSAFTDGETAKALAPVALILFTQLV
jgi:hypothetical protein